MTRPPPECREASAADLPFLRRLLGAAGLPSADLRIEPGLWHLVCAGGTLLAVAGLEPHGRCALLRSVAVDARARGCGHGTRLVERVLGEAARRGYADLYLLTLDADGFFARFGFERVERARAPRAIRASREFAELCPASAVLMHRAV